jgi:hypothetical protein
MEHTIIEIIEILQGDKAMWVIESGWHDRYHVITEDPTEGDFFHDHKFVSKRVLKEKYKIDLDNLKGEK